MMQAQLSRAFLLAGAGLALAAGASAQDINFDVSALSGTPSSSYGAAAAQPGLWNSIDASSVGTVFPLQDVSGAATGASLSYVLIGNGTGNFNFNNVATTGDDEALLDDFQDTGSGTSLATWTITGLSAANYSVYTYAWAADEPVNSTTTVRVVGSSDPDQTLGGNWTGAHVQGVTYAKHAITVAAGGQIVIELTVASGFGSINGVQLVEEGGGTGPAKFCSSRPSSLPNCTPTLDGPSTSASKSAGAGSYDITAQPVPGGANPGILIYSKFAPIPPISSQFGQLCLSNFLRAGNPQFVAGPGGTNGVCDGSYTWDGGAIFAFYGQIASGDTLHIQAWYRDPGNPGTANLTEGIGPVTITP